jgi:paraquat-inducible protein A
MAALIFIILLHSFPIISMEAVGNHTKLTLIESIKALILHKDYLLAGVVAVFTVISPVIFTLGLLYVILPLRFGVIFPGAKRLNVWVQMTQQWAMLEVFLLGFIVSLLKLGHIAELHFGVGLWSLVSVVVCLAASMSSIDRRELWDRLEIAQSWKMKKRKPSLAPTSVGDELVESGEWVE